MADLSNPSEKPSVSPEALLRALGVTQPGTGLSWEARARLAILGGDYSRAVPEPTLPVATWGPNNVGAIAAVPATWGGIELRAGRRGVWWGATLTDAGGGAIAKLLFMSETQWATWTTTGIGNLWPDTVAGGFDPTDLDLQVDGGRITNVGPGAGQPGARIVEFNWGARDQLWLPAGWYAYLLHDSQNVAVQCEGVYATAPLAGL